MPPPDSDPPDSDPLDGGPLFCLVGPTASGKTRVALALAERARAEVLSMDSMLVYRGLDVGTAKPSAAERTRVRHHLIDLVEPERRFTVQDWLEAARVALASVRARGLRALFAGGTPLYLKALCQGLFEGPPADLELRERLVGRARSEGLAALHAELGRRDPESAARIHPHDEKRIVRALETLEQTGRPLSAWQREWEPGAAGRARRIAGLAFDPAIADERIRARAEAMIDGGWPEEALELERHHRLGPTARQALGYAEALELAHGRIDRETCIERVVLRTRQLARRQRTWLRSFPEIVWVEAPRDEGDVGRAADACARALGWNEAG